MQGSMLERQHGELVSLRQDVQDLTESLEAFQGNFDQGADAEVRPSRLRMHRPAHRGPATRSAQRVRLDEPEGGEAVRKELADQRKSERDAVAKAREAQSKLSISENARKAEEKAKLEATTNRWRPLVWGGVVVALLAIVVRSWLRNRG
jgi:vancomycin resistance protein YoaR